MTLAEIPSLYPDVAERNLPPGRGQHAYYKRRSDGWIITSGAWPSAKADKEFKGYDYLPAFGTFLMSFGDDINTANQRDRTGRKFFPHKEPWRLILQHPDGPAQFPVAQIIAYRWHLRPPYREVRFPQMADVNVTDLFCPECEAGIFSSESEQEAVDMLRTHLTSKINDTHQYRPEDFRSLGESIGVDFFAPRRPARQVRYVPSYEDEEPEGIDLTESSTFICSDCEREFSSAAGLASHRRSHERGD